MKLRNIPLFLRMRKVILTLANLVDVDAAGVASAQLPVSVFFPTCSDEKMLTSPEITT